MAPSVNDLSFVLQAFFPAALPLQRAFQTISTFVAALPLLKLHQIQQREPRQPAHTAWLKSIRTLFSESFGEGNDAELAILLPVDPGGRSAEDVLADNIVDNIEPLCEYLGLEENQGNQPLFPKAPQILVTARLCCSVCPADQLHSLRRRVNSQKVRLLDKNFEWCTAELFIAHCVTCLSDYFPDKYTFVGEDGQRHQKLEYDAQVLRVSKSGVWIHRNIAIAQEKALNRFHSGWSNFASWLNDILVYPAVTNRQSQRLFIEHFSRRLLLAHGKDQNFSCSAHPSTSDLAESVRNILGRNGGSIPSSLPHGCTECTHKKRYKSDLVAEGAVLEPNANNIAGIAENGNELDQNLDANQTINDLPANMHPPVQEILHEDEASGYVRMAVMDGKTIGHRICALDTCNEPLVNYKNGRFCALHLNLKDVCGIIPCGRPVSGPGCVTCNTPSHSEWHEKYQQRFSRLSYPGVQRVIRRQQASHDDNSNPRPPSAPVLQVQQQLPSLDDIPGSDVVHTFRARHVYCVETVQWACGIPIGWGKCYTAESAPQVLAIIDRIWDGNNDLRPGFIAYDDACDLLRHIVTQDAESPWLKTTKFVVDAWHYIGHRATDILCRIWCNPAPTNGSQPDLIITRTDENGHVHTTRAFNTETAEHLNAWLNGFEAGLRQMSEVNFDFFMHSLMLVYKESVEDRIEKKQQQLTEEFWDEVGI